MTEGLQDVVSAVCKTSERKLWNISHKINFLNHRLHQQVTIWKVSAMNKRSGKEGQLDQLKESRHLFRQPLRKQFKHWREQMILGEMPMVVGGTWCIEQWKFGRTIICCIFCTVKRSSYLPVNDLYHGGKDSWWRGEMEMSWSHCPSCSEPCSLHLDVRSTDMKWLCVTGRDQGAP